MKYMFIAKQKNGKPINGKMEANVPIEISNKKNGNGGTKRPKNFKNITTIQLPELEASKN